MQNIGLILYPNFQVLGLSICSVFEFANIVAQRPLYSINLLSEHGGPVRTSAGFDVETEAFDQRLFDTLIVMGDNIVIMKERCS